MPKIPTQKRKWNIYNSRRGVFDARSSRNMLWVAANQTHPKHLRKQFSKVLQNSKADHVFLITPSEYRDIYSNTQLNFHGMVRQVLWYEALLKRYSKQINIFLNHYYSFEHSICLGDYPKAKEDLRIIEEKFGVSNWLVTSWITVLTSTQPITTVQDYINDASRENNAFESLYDRFFIKSQTDNYDRFSDSLFHALHEYRNSNNESTADFASFFLLPLAKDPLRDHETVLELSTATPLIDQYLNFKLCIAEFLSKEGGASSSLIKEVVSTLSAVLDDHELLKLTDRLQGENSYRTQQLEALRLYTKGDYTKCSRLLFADLNEDSSRTECLELLAKSLAYQDFEYNDQSTDVNKVISLLVKIIKVDSKCTEYIKELKSILIKNYPQRWTIPVISQFYNLFQHRTEEQGTLSAKVQYFLGCETTPKTDIIANSIPGKSYCGPTIDILKDAYNDVDPTPLRSLKYRLEEKICENEELINYNIIKESGSLNDVTLAYEIESLQTKLYMHNKEYEKALKLIADCCIDNIESYRCFPVLELIHSTETEEYDDCIYRPIVLHVYNQKTSHVHFDDLNDSYDNYMTALGIHLPSFAYLPKDKISKFEAFFLYNICVPNVMDVSEDYDSSTEVYSERIRILDYLIQHHESHPQILHNDLLRKERNEFVDRIVVEQGKLKYDMSKIYIDLNSILKNNHDKFVSTYETLLQALEKETTPGDVVQVSESQYTMNSEADITLYGFIDRFLKEFVKNADYGLDKSLSTEVRHGVFPNLIRARFDNNHLVTEIGESGNYESNEYWINKYPILRTEVLEDLDLCFSRFSAELDRILTDDEWMKVTLERDNTTRAFNFHVSLDLFDKLKREIYQCNSYQCAMTYLTEMAWELLDNGIADFLDQLYAQFKNSVESAIYQLEEEVFQVKQEVQMQDLVTSINLAKTGFSEDLKTVSDWFKISRDLEIREHSMDAIIKIAIESYHAIKLNRGTTFSKKYPNDPRSTLFSGKDSKALITSLMTAFDNATKYGISNGKNAITIEFVKSSKHEFKLTIYNPYQRTDNEADRTAFYISINEKINSPSNPELMYLEGGTGLYKIKHLLSNSNPNFKIDVYEKDESNFALTIKGELYENPAN